MPLGLAHSDFLGWDPADQDKALAHVAEERIPCSRCHTRRDEWFDEDGKRLMVDPYRPALEQCPGCEILDIFTDEVRREHGEDHGLHIVLRPAEA